MLWHCEEGEQDLLIVNDTIEMASTDNILEEDH